MKHYLLYSLLCLLIALDVSCCPKSTTLSSENASNSLGIEITHLLSFEQFENIKKFVLDQGQTQIWSSRYGSRPYYKLGDIELFLRFSDSPSIPNMNNPNTYNMIELEMRNPPQDYQFRYTYITCDKKTKKSHLSPYGKETKKSLQLRYQTIGKYLTEIISEIQKVENDEFNSAESSDKSIEGRYRNSEETTCELLLNIFKSGDGYSYTFQVKDRLYEGNISISTLVNGEEYITLEGIPWVKNIGPIDADEDPDNMEGYPTYGIGLYWYDHEIGFQNYGNAMNYYVKLDCDEKYIRFVKD